MKPGEYIGADGRTYLWQLGQPLAGVFNWYLYTVAPDGTRCHASMGKADWPAAKAALDALIAEEAEGWVEWRWQGYDFRCRADGSEFQERLRGGGALWNEFDDEGQSIGTAYRKGRSVALEQVKELVEAVEAGPKWDRENPLRPSEYNYRAMVAWYNALREAAKKVRG